MSGKTILALLLKSPDVWVCLSQFSSELQGVRGRDSCSITSETPPKWTVKMMNLEGSGFIILYSPNLLLEKFQEATSISLDNSEEKGIERENFHAQMTMPGTITLCCMMGYGKPT